MLQSFQCDAMWRSLHIFLHLWLLARATQARARRRTAGRDRKRGGIARRPHSDFILHSAQVRGRPSPRRRHVGAAAGRTRCRSSSRRRHFLISFGFKWTEHLEHLETARRRPEGVRGRAPSPMLNCKKKHEKQSRASCASIANGGSARSPAQQNSAGRRHAASRPHLAATTSLLAHCPRSPPQRTSRA